ncbi:tetratricopeptide repeat protein [candidate division CSSED10-310 bacterium]|uniref:Tetratricopeptide repeat protein n=1 Tax=candidate division CSSED10-310 bacterium TaxID=2855610 RepID=A0ABV6YZ94_UNCC1
METKHEEPTSIGFYRILAQLGRGGMGVVFRAQHRETNNVVALKTVRVPDEKLLQSIRREIRALARIQHPGIVRIVDHGLDNGVPWYAMELVDGMTLGSFINELRPAQKMFMSAESHTKGDILETVEGEASAHAWWTQTLNQADFEDNGANITSSLEVDKTSHQADAMADIQTTVIQLTPELLQSILNLITRLCVPLSFLHGEGIIHRDIKPDNIIVRSDGQPVLVDFGLTAQFGGLVSREALQVSGLAVGTASYIAPEQIRGELVDARADLYSLGCIMYELLTGSPPFHEISVTEVLQGHLTGHPVPPSYYVKGLPDQLNDLILRLLAKQPCDRLGYADDVASELARLGAAEVLENTGPKPRSYLYRAGFTGRSSQLSILRCYLAQLEERKGSILMLGGESGVGKTRLAMELGREATEIGSLVLAGECLDTGDRALEGFRKPLQSIADRCRDMGKRETEALLGHRGKVLAVYEQSLTSLEGQDMYPEPVKLPLADARIRLFTYLADTLRVLAERRKLLLIIDDLQWADDLTAGFFEFIVQGDLSQRLTFLVVGTYRTEEVSERLRPIIESSVIKRVDLTRLDQDSVFAIVGDMLALSTPSQIFSTYLLLHSEGNPFFIAEFLRGAVDQGLLRRDNHGEWHLPELTSKTDSQEMYQELGLPHSLRDLVRRRLEGLDGTTIRIVKAGAVLGREAPITLLCEMCELEETELLDEIEELRRRQILEEIKPGTIRFVHDKIREVAYEQIAASTRCNLHRTAAEALENLFSQNRLEYLAAIANHWEQAREKKQAKQNYLAAARYALSTYAYQEAEKHYRKYLTLTNTPDQTSIAVRHNLAEKILQMRGRSQEAHKEYQIALDESRAIGHRSTEARSLQGLGSFYSLKGSYPEARNYLKQALDIYQTLGDRHGEVDILANLAGLHRDQSQIEEARTRFQQVLTIRRQLDDRLYEGNTLGNLAILHHHQGQFQEGRLLCEQALAIFRELGDKRSEAIAMANLAVLLQERGRYEEALALHEKALDIQCEVGDRRTEGITLTNIGFLHWALGNHEKAYFILEQSLAIRREISDRPGEGVVLSSIGRIHYDLGDIEQAREILDQALRITREVENQRQEAMLLRSMALLARQVDGDHQQAARLIARAKELIRNIGDRLQLSLILCEQGHQALAQGNSPSLHLKEAEELSKIMEAGPESEIGQALGQLKRALHAQQSGQNHRLFRGSLFEDIPERLRNNLGIKTRLDSS